VSETVLNNTAVKYLKNFNKIIKLCLANDWLDNNPFANYKSKVKEVERVYLTEYEIQSIIEKDLKTERLSLVRDIFLFSCFTGLAYIDVKDLTKSHIASVLMVRNGDSLTDRKLRVHSKFQSFQLHK
jgi:hypothetical protein